MAIKLIDDRDLWDDFIDKSPYGLLFHKWDFLRIIEKHSGYKLYPYGIYKGEELICVFPLFYMYGKLFKSIFSPPPQTCVPYLGPVLGPRYDTFRQRRKELYLCEVVDEINEEIKRLAPNYISIYLSPMLVDIRPFKWSGYGDASNFTYTLDLAKSLEELTKGMDMSTKRDINKASRHPLRIEELKEVDTFYSIMKKRYSEQGLNFPILSADYLRELIDAYPDNLKMHFLYRDQEIVAIAASYEYKNKVMDWLGGAKLNNGIAGNDYLKWEIIKKAKADGFTEYELQGAGEKRLSQFKSKFNPRLDIWYSLHKKDTVGTIAEWAYLNLYRKRTFAFNYLNILTQYMV